MGSSRNTLYFNPKNCPAFTVTFSTSANCRFSYSSQSSPSASYQNTMRCRSNICNSASFIPSMWQSMDFKKVNNGRFAQANQLRQRLQIYGIKLRKHSGNKVTQHPILMNH